MEKQTWELTTYSKSGYKHLTNIDLSIRLMIGDIIGVACDEYDYLIVQHVVVQSGACMAICEYGFNEVHNEHE